VSERVGFAAKLTHNKLGRLNISSSYMSTTENGNYDISIAIKKSSLRLQKKQLVHKKTNPLKRSKNYKTHTWLYASIRLFVAD